MKRILLLTLEFPPMRGGLPEYLYGLFGTLPPESVAVLAPEASEPTQDFPCRVIRKRLMSKSGWPLWRLAYRETRAADKAVRPDLIAVSHLLPMGYVAWLMRKLHGRPYLVFVHGTDLKRARRKWWKRFWAARILSSASLVIANSEYTKRLAVMMGAHENATQVIYPCPAVGHVTFGDRKAARDHFGVHGKKMLLSVGQLVRRKGFDRVISALPALRRSCGDVVAIIIGDGPERQALDGLARKLGVRSHVFIRRGVSREEINAYYRAADAFVLPARELADDVEGFGIVLVEASAYGLPVVTTRVGGIPEAVVDGQTGRVLDADVSDAALADALCHLLFMPETGLTMGRNGRKRVDEMFQWRKQGKRFAELLERL